MTSKQTKVHVLWSSHLKNTQDRKKYNEDIINFLSDNRIKKLVTILETKKQEVLAYERTKTQYSEPSWSHRQAHTNGNLEILDLVLSLLEPTT